MLIVGEINRRGNQIKLENFSVFALYDGLLIDGEAIYYYMII